MPTDDMLETGWWIRIPKDACQAKITDPTLSLTLLHINDYRVQHSMGDSKSVMEAARLSE